MKFSQLPEDIQEKLKASGVYICSTSSAVETQGQLVDAIRMMDADAAMKMDGYAGCSAETWFEYVTGSLSDEDSLRLAENALLVQ